MPNPFRVYSNNKFVTKNLQIEKEIKNWWHLFKKSKYQNNNNLYITQIKVIIFSNHANAKIWLCARFNFMIMPLLSLLSLL
jgi:hypothetical protein